MDNIDVPEYFTCPISLQLMKDPVTVITGISYDRQSIEHWLFNNKNPTCPITKQILPNDSDLTPNHTLRRLIQSWCTENASLGVDRIPTPKPPLTIVHTLKLTKNLTCNDPNLELSTLRKLELLAVDCESNRKCLLEAGVDKAVGSFISKCWVRGQVLGLEEALSILYLLRITKAEMKGILVDSSELLEALTWILGFDDNTTHDDQKMECKHSTMKMYAIILVKKIVKAMSFNVLERLKLDFFERVVHVVRSRRNKVSQQGTNAALHVLLDSSHCGKNRAKILDSGAVFELIELEIQAPEKHTSEIILGLLFNLCSSADGRAQLLNHAGGLAVVTKRLCNVSPFATDRAVFILSLISRFSGNNNEVLEEMLNVGAFSKLCMVLQSESAGHLKDKAKEILKSHYYFLRKSNCINVSLLARCTR